jgi:hypothetical protein
MKSAIHYSYPKLSPLNSQEFYGGLNLLGNRFGVPSATTRTARTARCSPTSAVRNHSASASA